MKYVVLATSIFTLAMTMVLTSTAAPPVAPAAGAPPQETDGLKMDRTASTPASPQRKPWLMIPHGGTEEEGCERVSLQDLELDFDATQTEAQR
ncbi:MAG: hypothetical protein KDA96_27825, partial [Planctomycetaceae bacterium]|nr:hypothetical protein [Planctomycetaceae bacterium]